MAETGKTHLVIIYTVEPGAVAEGDRIFQSHADWMQGHPRDGANALLSYTISKGPELENPVDPSSSPTGKTVFVLDEIYESPSGVAEHWKQAVATWSDFGAIVEWAAKAEVTTLHSGTIVHALW